MNDNFPRAARNSTQSFEVGNFVRLTLLESLTTGFAVNARALIGGPYIPTGTGNENPAYALMCILRASALLCTTEPTDNQAALTEVFSVVRKFFEVTDGCHPEDESATRELLEFVVSRAEKDAYAGLHEALAGFPQCGGDFARWREIQMSRR